MIRMTASSRPARKISCAGRRGASAEAFKRAGGRDETVIRIIPRIPPIIPLAFQAYLHDREPQVEGFKATRTIDRRSAKSGVGPEHCSAFRRQCLALRLSRPCSDLN